MTELIRMYDIMPSVVGDLQTEEIRSLLINIFPVDADWHKLSQHGTNLLSKLCKNAITSLTTMMRVVDPSREIFKTWQEGDFTVQFGFEYIVRELAPFYFKSDVHMDKCKAFNTGKLYIII